MSANVFHLPTRSGPARLRPEWAACIIAGIAGVVGMDTVGQAHSATAAARRIDLHPIVRTAGDVVAPPDQIAYIEANFPARIERVRVLLGANVKEGQPIADLAAPGIDARLASAEAAYQAAAQAYKSASAKPDPAVKSAREAFALAKAEERKAREQASTVVLAADTGSPAAELDRLAYTRSVAGQELWTALQARDEALSGIREHLDRAKAELIAAKREKRNSQILAPMSGTVIRLALVPGMAPSNESPEPAVTIVNLNKLVAKTALPSGSERAVQPGTKAKIQIGELRERGYSGIVTGVEELMADRGNVVKQAIIRITDNEGYAKPGMQASVAFSLPVRKQALVVPIEAVRFGDASRTVVRVVKPKGVEERAVTLGASDGVNQEICGGLQPGEVVELTSTRH